MKKQNKKAFTLVELLVVIAILAILASVAVVGYTSFLKNAAVSNDETLAAQMNRYLEALKADSTSEYYNQDIHAGNVNKLTELILKDGGLGEELVPESAKYGYNFYFNLDSQKYELKRTGEVGRASNDSGSIFNRYAHAEGERDVGYEMRLENCFASTNNYFLADTKGVIPELVDSINALTLNDFADWKTKLEELVADLDANDAAALREFFAKAVVIGNNVNYRGSAELPEYVFFMGGVEIVGMYTEYLDANGKWVKLELAEGEKYYLSSEDKVTLPDTLPVFNDGSLTFKHEGDKTTTLYSDKSAKDVADKVGKKNENTDVDPETIFTNANLHLNDGSVYTAGTHGIKNSAGEQVHRYSYDYVLQGVKIDFAGEGNEKEYIVTLNPVKSKYQAGDYSLAIPSEATSANIKIFLDGADRKDEKTHVLGVDTLEWKVEDAVKTIVNCSYEPASRTLKLSLADGETWPKSFTVTADNKRGVRRDFTINVDTITGGTINFNGVTLSNGANVSMTIVGSSNTAIPYPITDLIPTYAWEGLYDVCDRTIACTYNGTGAVIEDNVLKANGNGSGELTIKVGPYLTYIVNLTIADTSNFPIQPKNTNITVLGNGNPVNVSELFNLVDGDAIPAGAELMVFGEGSFGGNNYMDISDRFPLQATAGALPGVSVDNPKQSINKDNFNDLTLDFDGADEYLKVSIAVVHNNVRISEDVIVTIVDGYNIRNTETVTAYQSLITNVVSSNKFTKSAVLLGNMEMTADVDNLTIPANMALYGNGFTFNVKAGRNVNGIIDLKGTIRDVMIVGSVYPDFAFSRGDEYGSSAVVASGNAKIINSYIANTRAPLEVSGNVVIEDSVLFGGRYANVDIVGGTLTVKGTVTTVQQVYSADGASNVIGIGISAWFNDGAKNVVIENGANLVQYNFMNKDIQKHLPTLSLAGQEILNLQTPFNTIFAENSQYKSYLYTSDNGGKYVNSGMVATDKYSVGYNVQGDAPKGFEILGVGYQEYQVGQVKTVKATTQVDPNASFTIKYNSSNWKCTTVQDTDGTVVVTGEQLNNGVVFTCHKKDRILGSDGVPYSFQVISDSYRTLNITGSQNYNNLEYTYSEDMSGKMGFVDGALADLGRSDTLHGKGLHYGKMCVDVNTPKPTATAFSDGNKTLTYQQLLEHYIEMTDGDKVNDNFYAPENFKFVNGSITNYWN